MHIRIFRLLSYPFYIFYEIIYNLIFKIKPLEDSIFRIESSPRRYKGKPLSLNGKIALQEGDKIFYIHIKRKLLRKIMGAPKQREAILREINYACFYLYQWSMRLNKKYGDFAGFLGETNIFFPRAKELGFITIQKNDYLSSLLSSLQQIYFKKNFKRFFRKKVYIYFLDKDYLLKRYAA